MIRIKRVYDSASSDDGAKFLVDRLWPRGVSKEKLQLTGWIKEVAPSDALRKWFGHDPKKWSEFQRRYISELKENPDAWKPLDEAARKGDVTLLFGAKDSEHNNAVVLKKFLEQKSHKSKQAR
jgi:uncharacterized protein YeaO (DUF488 family)